MLQSPRSTRSQRALEGQQAGPPAPTLSDTCRERSPRALLQRLPPTHGPLEGTLHGAGPTAGPGHQGRPTGGKPPTGGLRPSSAASGLWPDGAAGRCPSEQLPAPRLLTAVPSVLHLNVSLAGSHFECDTTRALHLKNEPFLQGEAPLPRLPFCFNSASSGPLPRRISHPRAALSPPTACKVPRPIPPAPLLPTGAVRSQLASSVAMSAPALLTGAQMSRAGSRAAGSSSCWRRSGGSEEAAVPSG